MRRARMPRLILAVSPGIRSKEPAARHGDEWNHSPCVVPPFPASSRLGDDQTTPNGHRDPPAWEHRVVGTAPNLMGNTPATALFVLAPGEIVSRSTEMVLGAEMQGRWHVGCGHLKTAGGKR